MATTPMLNLPVATSLSGSESVWIVQGGTDKRTTMGAFTNAFSSIGAFPFVVASTDAGLVGQRVLTAQAGVTTVSDAGAGLTITVGIATNGIGATQFRQSTGISVVGNQSTTVGNIVDIVGTADQVLQVSSDGSSLAFRTQVVPSTAISGTIPSTQITGTFGTSQGGTNLSSYNQGDMLYADPNDTLVRLAKNTTATRYISNTGSSNNPVWSQVNLSNGVSATLGATNGGTGLSSYTIGDILYATSTDVLAQLARSTAATRYLSNTGSSNVPAWAQVSLSNGVTGTLPVANGGTGGATSATARSNLETMGAFRTIGLDCHNSTAASSTQFVMNADAVLLWNSSGAVVTRVSPGALTNVTTAAGPIANGRDVAAAFNSSTWIHFYWIWNSSASVLATLSSTMAPPTGPTLPSGYGHWSYAGAVYNSSLGSLYDTHIHGSLALYTAVRSVLTGGNSTSVTAIDFSAFVPPNALTMETNFVATLTSTSSGAAENILIYHSSTANITAGYGVYIPIGNVTNSNVLSVQLLNLNQQAFYQWSNISNSSNVSTRALTVFSRGYELPNGGN